MESIPEFPISKNPIIMFSILSGIDTIKNVLNDNSDNKTTPN
jgi:hypothetical protein